MTKTQEAETHLLGASDIQRIAASIGVTPTKKLGQNFMIDPGTVRRIARTAHVGSDSAHTQVVEVGPGLGSLTLALLEAGAHVHAVEIDTTLAQQLPLTVERYAPHASTEQRLAVITRDALKVTAEDFHATTGLDTAEPFALVSNLPYNVATPILLTFLERFAGLSSAVVLVQNEVAERLTAAPGSKIYGSPSVKLAWYGKAQKAGMVGRNVFWPVPNVDSSLVEFTRFTPEQAGASRPAALKALTFELIDAAFAQRRKTLRAALKGHASAEQIATAGIEPTLRGEKLTVDDFVAIAREVAKAAPTDESTDTVGKEEQ
ncbi:MAG: 16S rRNA (adenine(1518)-N(6)/adenine(1519)-N(6))-dimethyltransferase RsmA [Bifidobacteriaceae bacterium]|nr:16S rRNA (adenine(1518)-N(6)/adenine(1519)-N(6))-dimethyltransferase RsmA [Bifidobacteriaceae bacterium]